MFSTNNILNFIPCEDFPAYLNSVEIAEVFQKDNVFDVRLVNLEAVEIPEQGLVSDGANMEYQVTDTSGTAHILRIAIEKTATFEEWSQYLREDTVADTRLLPETFRITYPQQSTGEVMKIDSDLLAMTLRKRSVKHWEVKGNEIHVTWHNSGVNKDLYYTDLTFTFTGIAVETWLSSQGIKEPQVRAKVSVKSEPKQLTGVELAAASMHRVRPPASPFVDPLEVARETARQDLAKGLATVSTLIPPYLKDYDPTKETTMNAKTTDIKDSNDNDKWSITEFSKKPGGGGRWVAVDSSRVEEVLLENTTRAIKLTQSGFDVETSDGGVHRFGVLGKDRFGVLGTVSAPTTMVWVTGLITKTIAQKAAAKTHVPESVDSAVVLGFNVREVGSDLDHHYSIPMGLASVASLIISDLTQAIALTPVGFDIKRTNGEVRHFHVDRGMTQEHTAKCLGAISQGEYVRKLVTTLSVTTSEPEGDYAFGADIAATLTSVPETTEDAITLSNLLCKALCTESFCSSDHDIKVKEMSRVARGGSMIAEWIAVAPREAEVAVSGLDAESVVVVNNFVTVNYANSVSSKGFKRRFKIEGTTGAAWAKEHCALDFHVVTTEG